MAEIVRTPSDSASTSDGASGGFDILVSGSDSTSMTESSSQPISYLRQLSDYTYALDGVFDYPSGWPPRPATALRSIRFYETGTTTADFADNAFLFSDQPSANTFRPMPYVRPGSTAPVAFGDYNVTGSPMGSGADVGADPDPIFKVPIPSAPHPMIWCHAIQIRVAAGSALEFSFDGANVHGRIPAGVSRLYFDRFEAGIAVRFVSGGAGTVFRIEAW